MSFVWHDNIGYIPLESNPLNVKIATQYGSWNKINRRYPDDPISGEVLTLWYDHGIKPKQKHYSYIVTGGLSREETKVYAENIPIRIISNTAALQAVQHKKLGVTGLAFFHPERVAVMPNLTIRADKPCLVIFNESKSLLC